MQPRDLKKMWMMIVPLTVTAKVIDLVYEALCSEFEGRLVQDDVDGTAKNGIGVSSNVLDAIVTATFAMQSVMDGDLQDPLEVNAALDVMKVFEKTTQTEILDSSTSSVNGFTADSELSVCEKMTILTLIKSDSQLKTFTGVTFALLNKLTELVTLICGGEGKAGLPIRDRIAMTLCRLRLNLSFEVLSTMFGVPRRRCSAYFDVMIHDLACVLKPVIYWPSREEIFHSMPKCFAKFQRTRVILDCTEIPADAPDCLKCKIRMYSHYKKTLTAKVMIGVAPSGLISFLSPVYGGKASDKFIFEASDLVQKDMLDPFVDAVMVDEGFRIDAACDEMNLPLIRPPFVIRKQQLCESDALRNAQIANARVHVERAIQRMKLFGILRTKLHWSMLPYIDDILTVICGITNLSSPILAAHRFIPRHHEDTNDQ